MFLNPMRRVSRSLRATAIWCLIVSGVAPVMAKEDQLSPERRKQIMREVNSVIQEIFWRVKAQDYTVFWENEMTYFQEETPVPKYLAQKQFTYDHELYPDSAASARLDSVTVNGDTCLAHLVTFVRRTSGDLDSVKTPQYLLHEAGRWKKVMSSTLIENELYFQRVREAQKAAESEGGK